MPKNVNNSAVGAAAKVNEKTKFKKSFTIDIQENRTKAFKRKVTMEFRVIYSKLVTKYLDTYKNLKVSFNAKGKLVKVEILENGTWMLDSNLTKEFSEFSIKKMQVHQEMTLILKK